MSEVNVKVDQLGKYFGDVVALESISFSIKEGEIFGFLGPSGSGKTTTINILTNQLKQDSGVAEVFGVANNQLSENEFRQIGIVGDESGYYEKFTLAQNIGIYSRLHQVPKDYVDYLLKEVGLDNSLKIKAENLSTGMRQRMLLVRALIHKPKVLFLDEPTSGLDPTTSQAIHRLLLKLKSEGVSIFLTTHDMYEAEKLCDRLVLLHDGYIVESGTPEQILKKHTTSKSVQITYDTGESVTKAIDELSVSDINSKDIERIHTLEPTLEDVFIKLTGVELDDE